jgi:glycosyltransferase involved in cell wall biosynthesis
VKLLLVCTTCPVPPLGGAALRELGWLRTAASFADVALVTLVRNEREHAALAGLEAVCRIVRGISAPRTAPRKVRDLFMAGLSGVPYLVWSGHDRRLHAAVCRIVQEWSPDVVQAELLPAAPYLEIARAGEIPTVYGAHNVESRIVAGPLGGRRMGSKERWMRRFEARVAGEADAVIAVSRLEAAWFRDHARQVHCIPNAVDLVEHPFVLPSTRSGRNLLFVGHLGYGPNVDAAKILARQIYPEVRRAVPDAACVIAGAAPSRAVRGLAGHGVKVVAEPQELATLWQGAGALVCPLRWGAGSRIKILEAAARGVPVVTTSFGAEGLELEAGAHYAVADDVGHLVDAAVPTLRNPEVADPTARAAREAVERHHSWPRLRSAMMELYEGLVGHHSQKRGARRG